MLFGRSGGGVHRGVKHVVVHRRRRRRRRRAQAPRLPASSALQRAAARAAARAARPARRTRPVCRPPMHGAGGQAQYGSLGGKGGVVRSRHAALRLYAGTISSGVGWAGARERAQRGAASALGASRLERHAPSARGARGGPCRTGHPWFSAPRGVGRRTNGCPALLLFPYSTLVVGLLIRWRLQTTVGPSEEGVTITLAGSIVARGSHHRIKKPRPAPCTSHALMAIMVHVYVCVAGLARCHVLAKQQGWPNGTERTLTSTH